MRDVTTVGVAEKTSEQLSNVALNATAAARQRSHLFISRQAFSCDLELLLPVSSQTNQTFFFR